MHAKSLSSTINYVSKEKNKIEGRHELDQVRLFMVGTSGGYFVSGGWREERTSDPEGNYPNCGGGAGLMEDPGDSGGYMVGIWRCRGCSGKRR